jgi:hypothetical protein
MPSRGISWATDERRLMATLGVYTLPYTLPPYALVRLENPPTDPNPRPLLLRDPKPCWFGRMARGIKMNDRSTAGNIYLGGVSGNEILTGLSRRRGGRWSGRRVY